MLLLSRVLGLMSVKNKLKVLFPLFNYLDFDKLVQTLISDVNIIKVQLFVITKE